MATSDGYLRRVYWPAVSTTVFTARIPDTLGKQVDRRAAQDGVRRNVLIRLALEEYVNGHAPEEANPVNPVEGTTHGQPPPIAA